MIIKSQQVFDKVCLDREKPYKPSDYIDFIIYSIKRGLINKLMNKLEDHKVYIVELKEPGILKDLPMTGKAIIEQDLVCEKLVQCEHCMMVYPWCQKFRDELDGHGFCPYGRGVEDNE